MPDSTMNIENITSQVIAGILTFIAIWALKSLYIKLKRLSKAKTTKEIMNNSFNAITSFFPAISSVFVLVFETWFISPRNIIDFIFIQFAAFTIAQNIAIVIYLIKAADIKTHEIKIEYRLDVSEAAVKRIEKTFDEINTKYSALAAEYAEYKRKYGPE
jgi:hypothetical protein